jgi:hypothetical protein
MVADMAESLNGGGYGATIEPMPHYNPKFDMGKNSARYFRK